MQENMNQSAYAVLLVQFSIILTAKNPSRGFSIFEDSGFVRTINALKAKSKQLKKQGKGENPNEASALTDQDIDILYSKNLLGMSTSESVINTLWYNNCYYFGMRGCTENNIILNENVLTNNHHLVMTFLHCTINVGISSSPKPTKRR